MVLWVFDGNMVGKWTNEPCNGADEAVNPFWVLTLGHNQLMKKLTCDNYIRYRILKITQNLIHMVKFTQETKTQQDTIQMQNYMIGKLKTMKKNQEDVGPFKKYRRNQSENALWCP